MNITITNKDGITLHTANKYCTEDVNVLVDDTNLYSSNIRSGVNILGVNGTFEGKTPIGHINITDTSLVDVTNYSTAQVVDENLNSLNIRSGVSILGVEGAFEGGGGSGGTNAVVLCNTSFYDMYAKINVAPTDTSDIEYTMGAAYSGVVPITVLDSDNSFVNVSKVYLWFTSRTMPMEKITVFINDVEVGTLARNQITEFEITTTSNVKIATM